MADEKKGGSKVKLDEFTARVVPDPKNPTDALLLTGFLGASSEAGQTRIYWDASLSSFVDVDTADILHTEPLPKDQSPLGGAYIWVKRSAEVSVGSAAGRSAKGKFFQGPLMAAYGGAFGAAPAAGAAGVTPGAAAAGAGGAAPWLDASFGCATYPIRCPSFKPCYTLRYECQSIWGACPSPFPFYCEPYTPGCPRFQAAAAPQAVWPSLACTYGVGCPGCLHGSASNLGACVPSQYRYCPII